MPHATTPAPSVNRDSVGPVITVGEFTLSLEADLLMHGEEVIPLGQRAVSVLRELAKRPGEVVSKAQLLKDAWLDKTGRQAIVEPGSLQVQIYNLRQVLGKDAIKTVMDRGYRLLLPVSLPAVGNSSFPVPIPAEPLVGREADEAALAAQLRQHRLVTLLGGPGVGKTSLAAQLAGRLGGENVQWLELASIRDEDSVIRLVAAAARVKLGDEISVSALMSAMEHVSGLLVLDNAEHIAELVARLCTGLLAHCPRISCLVTSQVPLKISGEHVHPLAPLGLPDELADDEAIRAAPAVQLFMRVAESRGVAPSWTSELHKLSRIVRALSGNALAIHHVAAHAGVLNLDEASEKVDALFHLSRANPNEPLRHRTLHDAFNWSHGLLDDNARLLFHALAQFPAGLDMASLQIVAGGLGIRESVAQDALRDLVDRSFVFRRPYTQRLMIPEAARHYSYLWLQTEQGRAQVSADVLDRNLVTVIHGIARVAVPGFLREPYPKWVERFTPEWDNLRAALNAASRLDCPDELVFIVCMSWWLWVQGERGYWVVHVRDLMTPEVLQRASKQVQLMYRYYNILTLLNPGSRELLEEPGVREALQKDDSVDLVALLAANANWHIYSDPPYAEACLNEAITLMRGASFSPPMQTLLLHVAVRQAIARNDARRARSDADRALALSEQCGPGTRCFSLLVAVHAALLEGDLARLQYLRDRLQQWGKALAGRTRTVVLACMAHGFAVGGDRLGLRQALEGLLAQQDVVNGVELHIMDYLASVALHMDDRVMAAGIFALGEAALERHNYVRDRVAQAISEQVRATLSAEEIQAAMESTLPMSMGEIYNACEIWLRKLVQLEAREP